MSRLWLLMLLSLFISLAMAQMEPGELHSQARLENESSDEAAARYFERLRDAGVRFDESESAYVARKPLDQLDYSFVPQWKDMAEIETAFRELRDIRFMYTDDKPNFLRRCSWLYPQDGCFARAALSGQNVAKWGYKRPAKIFVFGNLKVVTKNAPQGYVCWWYHVVLIVGVEGRFYVFDPAIDPYRPLPLQDWLKTMNDNLLSLRATVCNPYTYVPNNPWKDATPAHEANALTDQKRYLNSEWANLTALGRNPERELGDNPPWGFLWGEEEEER